jgi:predicted Rdx family selenoprotein
VAAEIKEAFHEQPELIQGKGGVFIVTADGRVVYDKKATGRFPKPGEVAKAVKA